MRRSFEGLCLDFHRYSVVYIFSAANLLGLYAELLTTPKLISATVFGR